MDNDNDVDARTFDIGVSSVRMLRAGSMIQVLFSNGRTAGFFYAEWVKLFEKMEMGLKGQ